MMWSAVAFRQTNVLPIYILPLDPGRLHDWLTLTIGNILTQPCGTLCCKSKGGYLGFMFAFAQYTQYCRATQAGFQRSTPGKQATRAPIVLPAGRARPTGYRIS